jgi:undecaprenyl-diphosphatase
MNSVIIFCAKYLFVLVVICLAVAWLPTDRDTKKRFIVATVLAGGIAFVLSRITGHLYYDPRPFVTEHVKPLISHGPDNGFPSDHALLTMTLTAITYFFNKKIASVMLVLTIAVGIARVLAKVHSPLDIGGGWVFGIMGAVCGFYLMRWIFAKYVKHQEAA